MMGWRRASARTGIRRPGIADEDGLIGPLEHEQTSRRRPDDAHPIDQRFHMTDVAGTAEHRHGKRRRPPNLPGEIKIISPHLAIPIDRIDDNFAGAVAVGNARKLDRIELGASGRIMCDEVSAAAKQPALFDIEHHRSALTAHGLGDLADKLRPGDSCRADRDLLDTERNDLRGLLRGSDSATIAERHAAFCSEIADHRIVRLAPFDGRVNVEHRQFVDALLVEYPNRVYRIANIFAIADPHGLDRQSDVQGKSGSVRLDHGGRRIIKKTKQNTKSYL